MSQAYAFCRSPESMPLWIAPTVRPRPGVQRAHPLHVAAGEVVVHRDDVHALAVSMRVEIRRQRGDERLAFAGDHFGDVAFVQDHAAHELHVVMPQADEPPAALAANGERFDQDVVERFAGFEPAAELGRLRAQLVVGHRLVLRLQSVDRVDLGLQPLAGSARWPSRTGR